MTRRIVTQKSEEQSEKPQTYAEAVASERAKWGDSWQEKADPVPVVCLEYKMAQIDLLRPVMAGPEIHRRYLACRVRLGQCPRDQLQRRAETGDRVRELILDWVGPSWAHRLARRHLSLLVSQQLLPRPPNPIVLEWLSLQATIAGRSKANLVVDKIQTDAD